MLSKNIFELSDVGTEQFLDSGYYTKCIEKKCDDLSDYLRRRFGLCAGGASPDAEVCFGERKGSAPALFLGTGCRARQSVEYALSAAYAPTLGPLPPDGRLLCALFQAGKLPIAAIGVKSVQHNA